MAKTAVEQWDTTAANNTDLNSIPIDGAVTTPSQVDNLFREMMAQIKTFSLFTSLTLTSTDAGATAGPIVTLYRNSATPASSDVIGKILFQGEDSAGNTEDYAEIYATILDPTSTSEDGGMALRTKIAGTMATHLTLTSSGATLSTALTAAAGSFTTLSSSGAATLASGSVTGAWTVSGAFTSLGIDDNATGERLQLADTIVSIGTAGVDYTVAHAANDRFIDYQGGNASEVGGGLRLFGSTHASNASDILMRSSTQFVYLWDFSAAQHSWWNGSGTERMTLSSAGALAIDAGLTATTGTFSGGVSVGDDLTVTDDIFCGVTGLINPAAAEYGMSVDAGGLLTISRNADLPLRVKRNGDGTLVAWYNGTTNVAVVSQAADVVTYGAFCGAHWSQWAGVAPAEVLRGTVLDTVDEMCVWDDTSSAEILPKVKVSNVVGSRRVYGVYSHPDSEDPDRDFHVASLGAFVVRIAGGIVVENGDLLESNGDGCARVQEFDGFTSRTIAKVTSSAVIETYPDGSYLVPCTLHCG